MNQIRVLFVLSENCTYQNQAFQVMLQAYESCKQNAVNSSWVGEAKLDSIHLSKTDFVVFQDFQGRTFDSLKESKCARILGPWCLLVCLMECKRIPNFTWPIYNFAMYGCVISVSQILKSKKLEIKEKVQLMGGCYTDSLGPSNTHLVTESVKSEKYLRAAKTGVKSMVSEWVDVVWEASQVNNVHCNDEKFAKYKCLPFHNLTISSTGFPSLQMKTNIAQIVAKNGGVYTNFISRIDVLVVYGEDGIMGKKYEAARSNENIFCVSVDWIHDSIAKGYALPHNLYTVAKKGTSTPTKEDECGPNFSKLSALGDMTTKCASTLEENVVPQKLQPLFLMNRISPNKSSSSEEVGKIIEGLDIKKAKKAGQYLDGCSGLSLLRSNKTLTSNDVEAAAKNSEEMEFDKPMQQNLGTGSKDEIDSVVRFFRIGTDSTRSIALDSKQTSNANSSQQSESDGLLRSNKTHTSNDVEAANPSAKNSEEMEFHKPMQQYLGTGSKDDVVRLFERYVYSARSITLGSKQTSNANSNQQSESDDETTQDTNTLYSKTFILEKFSPEEAEYIGEHIEYNLGTVMPKTYNGIPDYVVAPAFIASPIQTSALEIVNNFWIFECIQEFKEIPIAYYHRPFVVCDTKPLQHCVVTIGGYIATEKKFLKELIETLVGNSAAKDSQPFTMGWDYEEKSQSSEQQAVRIFIISGVEKEHRQSIVDKIESLGGQVFDLNSYHPQCTHLICSKPARNEKTLSCIASGKWILHISYVDKCIAAGKFLPEEDFEFGNPKAKENIKITFDKENELRLQSIHWWRKEISRRGYGAFSDMRAIVVAQKRDPIIRVIEAGGGQIVDAKPPFGDNIHATHCLIEDRCVSDFGVYNPLAQKGVLCINTLYISDFLYRTNKDIKDAILPHFSKFYS